MKWTVAENLADIKLANKKKFQNEILCLTYEVYLLGKSLNLNVTFVRDILNIDDIIFKNLDWLNEKVFQGEVHISIEAHRSYLSALLLHLKVSDEVASKLCLERDPKKFIMLIDAHCIDGYYKAFRFTKYNKINSSNALKVSILRRSNWRNKILSYFLSMMTFLSSSLKLLMINLYEIFSFSAKIVTSEKNETIIIGWGRDFVRYFDSDNDVTSKIKTNSIQNIITRPRKVKGKTFKGDVLIAKETILFRETFGISLGNFSVIKRISILLKYVKESFNFIKDLTRSGHTLGVDLLLYVFYYHRSVVLERELFNLLVTKRTKYLITSDADLPAVRYLLLYGIKKDLKVYSTVHGSTLYDYFGKYFLANYRITNSLCFANGYREGDLYLNQHLLSIEDYIEGNNCIMIATRSNGNHWSNPTFNQIKFYEICNKLASDMPEYRFIIKSHPSSDAYYLYSDIAKYNKNVTHDNSKFDMNNFKSITALLSIGDLPSLIIDAIAYKVPVFYFSGAQNKHQKKYSYGFEDNFLIDSYDELVDSIKNMCMSNMERKKLSTSQYRKTKKITLRKK